MRLLLATSVAISLVVSHAPAQEGHQRALAYGTYLGGERGAELAVTGLASVERDTGGDIIVAGSSKAVGIATPGAPQEQPAGESDALVARYSADGELLWATYFGSAYADYARDVAVDAAGAVYITGWTFGDYPTTQGPDDTCEAEKHSSFVTKFTSEGALAWSTCIGVQRADGIALSPTASIIVSGDTESDDLPSATRLGPGGANDVFVLELTPDGSEVARATVIGGSSGDGAHGMVLDDHGAVYVTGGSGSTDWPITPGAADDTLEGRGDGTLFKLSPDLGTLEYSTFEGAGRVQAGAAVDVDGSGQACAAGNEFRKKIQVWVLCLNAEGTERTFSFRHREDGDLIMEALRFQPNGHLLVAGRTDSKDLFVVDALQGTAGGERDGWIADLNLAGDEFFSTYIGGSDDDWVTALHVAPDGGITFVGDTRSDDQPRINPWQSRKRGSIDGYLGVIGFTDGGCRLLGTPGPDRIWGSVADDRICALRGDDVVRGDDGDDRLLGGSGDDRLYGQRGRDRANGGRGEDLCKAERKISC